MLSIERADWPKLHDKFKTRDANFRQRQRPSDFRLEFAPCICHSSAFIHDVVAHIEFACVIKRNKANLRDLIAATGLIFLLKLDSNRWLIMQPLWSWNFMNDLERLEGTSTILHQALCIISNPSVNSDWSYSPQTLNSGKHLRFFVPHDLEIWRMTLKNNRALLYYVKLCASFQIHQWSQTWVTVRNAQSFSSRVTLKFDGMLTLKNNRAHLLFHVKLCVAFQSRWYIQNGVTVRKCAIRVRIGDFFVPRDLENWHWTIGHLSYSASSFVHHFIAIGEFKLRYSLETHNLGQNRQSSSRVTLKFDGWPWKIIGHLF